MALRPSAWIREKGTKDWHRTRIPKTRDELKIVTRCGREDLEWDRAATMPGAGAAICRACLEAEEFDEGEKVMA